VRREKLVNELGRVLGLVFLLQSRPPEWFDHFSWRKKEAKKRTFLSIFAMKWFHATWFRFDEVCKDPFSN